MGTSKASGGSPSKVPMVPPWVPEVAPEEPPEDEPHDADNEGESHEPDDGEVAASDTVANTPPDPVPIAPVGRFASTRRTLGRFASLGGKARMRRAIGRYVHTGLGGSGTAARRFGGTARTADALYRVLGGGDTATPDMPGQFDRDLLAGKSARDVIDAVIEAAGPVDGTQDTEASRQSINDALAELMTQYPDVDILNMSEEQRVFVIERFVGMDVFRRFVLDVGTIIHEKAPSISTALSRLKEVREYTRETVVAAFRKLRAAGQRLTSGRVARLVKRALEDAFDVFSGYAL